MREAPGTRARRRRGSTGRLRSPVTNSNRRVRSPTAHEVRRVVCAAVPRVDGLLRVRAEWALPPDALPRIVVHVLRGDDLVRRHAVLDPPVEPAPQGVPGVALRWLR